ncbi:hypothetical protein POJ06DRAFT_47673 [Lipomyces tetrasporus]|uniref:Uncharacterized protein n=1 Tax=Lipomyces tetrasporus TaxID=54092 RepID=A0AAD7QJV5_9ASCO|nr:uncharacterized protein POJ06DRAFT_47673 [Lipomyces tetrasporus]KAJ8096496.1 hypothetical protein POJ06DRAFT_47673 [Lipomyces tetrasporus]
MWPHEKIKGSPASFASLANPFLTISPHHSLDIDDYIYIYIYIVIAVFRPPLISLKLASRWVLRRSAVRYCAACVEDLFLAIISFPVLLVLSICLWTSLNARVSSHSLNFGIGSSQSRYPTKLC